MDNSEVDNLQPVTREHLDFKLVRDDFNEHDVARSLKTINGLEEEMTKNDNVYTHRKIDQCELRPIKGGLSESDRAGQVMNQNIAEDENKGRDYSAIDNRHPCKDKSGSSDHKSSPSFAKETEHVRIRSGSQVNECREYLEPRIISSLSKPENDLQDKQLDRNGCEECSDLQGTCAHALCATASSESISREENVEEAFAPHSDVVRKALAFSMAPKVVEVESSKNFQGKVDQALRYKLDMHDFKRSSKRVHKDFYVIFPGRVIDIPHTCFLHYEDYRDAVIHNYAVKHADIHSVLTTDTFDYFMEALIKRRVIKGTRGLRNRYNSVKEVRGTRSRFAHREQEKHVQRPKRTVGCMCRRSRRPKKRTRAAAGEELGLVTRRRGMLGLMLAPILRAIRKRF
ncbi:predicted protein [Nematostella vectensis]|uniref:Uncharacterized protein n=1 Tax=Nematostella vectensis TaxID=45351 RepID=A7SEI4_NEMVE|nr:predicted protein [Nematostella vectensis]|eukprot:XP_001629930.1 predicted protein [Nematostella vectensis]